MRNPALRRCADRSPLYRRDNVNLVPGLYDEVGGFTLGIVFAHEFGHAIQDRASVTGDTIMTELQADCFAGAWTGDVEAGNSDFFELTLNDLDRAVAGFLELRDGVGTDSLDPAAHGTGFDRIGSFSEGYDQGPERCAEYPDLYAGGELFITEVPFTDQADFDNEGNLPLDEAGPLAIEDLEDFWATIFTEFGETWTPVTAVTPIDPSSDTVDCGGETYSGDVLVNASFYCIDTDTIFIDGVNLIPSLYDIGDYALATELARQYAYAAQVRLGNTESSLASNLQVDCYAGLFASSGFLGNRGENQKLFLSPGDLDEAVIAFLQTSDAGEDVPAGDGTVPTVRRLPRWVPAGHRCLRCLHPRRLTQPRYRAPARARRDWRTRLAVVPPITSATSARSPSCSAPPRSPASAGAAPESGRGTMSGAGRTTMVLGLVGGGAS